MKVARARNVIENKEKSEAKGITLIALVITIIVLLILAGISLALVLGKNGIITRAKEAKDKYEESVQNELMDIATIEKEAFKTKEGYEKLGLVLQYDGVNNTKAGHSDTTGIWEDLVENKNGKLQNFSQSEGSGWTAKGLQFDGIDDWVKSINPLFKQIGDTPNMTVEIVYSNSKEDYQGIISFTHHVNQYAYMDLWPTGQYGTMIWFYYDNWDTSERKIDSVSFENIYNKTLTVSYGKNDTKRFAYKNGNNLSYLDMAYQYSGWKGDQFYLGRAIDDEIHYYFQGIINSVRIYDRELTTEEIQNNYQVDKERFQIEE